MSRTVVNGRANIPWLRTLLLSTMLAALSSIVVVVITGNVPVALGLFAVQTTLFFLIFALGMWWADTRR